MTRARDISRFGDEKGTGNAVNDADGLFAWVGSAVTVTSNINLDSTNSGPSGSYVFIKENQLDIETGIAVTVGQNKTLVIDTLNLP